MCLNRNRKNHTISYRNMKNLNENEFKHALSQAPWDTVFLFDDINEILDSWELLFNSVLDSHCPWREKRVEHFFLFLQSYIC